MASLNISLPEQLRKFVESEVERGGYSSASELFRELLRDFIRRQETDELERKLLEGMASPSRTMDREEWRRVRSSVKARRRRSKT